MYSSIQETRAQEFCRIGWLFPSEQSIWYMAYIGRLPRSLAYQAGLAVVGQTGCGLQVHIPADVQVCRQAPTKHSSVKPAEVSTSISSPQPG